MLSLVRLTHLLLLPPLKFETDRKKGNLYLGRLTHIGCSRRYGYVESRLALALGTSQIPRRHSFDGFVPSLQSTAHSQYARVVSYTQHYALSVQNVPMKAVVGYSVKTSVITLSVPPLFIQISDDFSPIRRYHYQSHSTVAIALVKQNI